MKAGTIKSNRIVMSEIEDISLGNRKGAIIKTLGCGLCGSDIVKFREKISPEGTVLGHEVVGRIVTVNSDTDFQVGDRIVTSHHIPCGECNFCRHGNVSMCKHFKSTNIVPGGFSEYIYVSEEHLNNVAYKVPVNISNEEISFYEPLACCLRAVRRCNPIKGDKILVVGLGSIGLLMGEAIKALGYEVFGCDLIEDRINLANSRGIKSYNSSNLLKFDEIIKSQTNGVGVNAVFMTSGADKAIDVGLKTVCNGGKILVFSSTPKNFGYANNEIYYKELTILGSYSPDLEDLKLSYELITNGTVNVKSLTTVYGLDKIQNAFEDTISNKIFKAFIEI